MRPWASQMWHHQPGAILEMGYKTVKDGRLRFPERFRRRTDVRFDVLVKLSSGEQWGRMMEDHRLEG